jgi:hypothetical protein
MAITLATEALPARTTKTGSETFTVAAGKDVEVAYWAPGKVRALQATVPAGKTWRVTVNVYIQET